MFSELETIDWQDCHRTYTRVEAQIGALTSDVSQRSAIYQLLWSRGGRCDCTTAFNVIKQPDIRSVVEDEIERLLKTNAGA